jgi:hypothetical protein
MQTVAIIAAIAGVVFLAYALLHSPEKPAPPPPAPAMSLTDELDHFVTDKMNYSVPFARALAQQRIQRAERIIAEHPEYEPMARRVIDTLQSRLAQKTVMQ